VSSGVAPAMDYLAATSGTAALKAAA